MFSLILFALYIEHSLTCFYFVLFSVLVFFFHPVFLLVYISLHSPISLQLISSSTLVVIILTSQAIRNWSLKKNKK